MNNNITIKNDFLTVEISPFGAELKSIKTASLQEHLWQGDAASWENQAPILFPVCGRLLNNKYTFNGKTYNLGMHGFARHKEFICEKCSQDETVFLLCADDETKAVYPFDFELRVTYALNGNSLKITHNVNNKTDGSMYFSIGTHEGYYCKGATADYGLILEGYDEIENSLFDGPFSTEKTEIIKLTDSTLWPSDDEFKRLDTFAFRNIKTKHVQLISKTDDRVIRVDFPDFNHLMIWKEPGAEFFCIEPWNGLPDFAEKEVDFSQKPDIIKLEKNGVYECTHSITIN